MFERFTDRARRIIVLAQEESRLLNHDHIGTEHLLLGLLREDGTETGRALQDAGVTLSRARRWVEQSHGRGNKKKLSGHIPFTPRAKQVLERAVHISQQLGGDTIGEPHLLRAMLDVPDGAACRLLLVDVGLDADELARVADELARRASAAGPEGRQPVRVDRPADARGPAARAARLEAALRRFGRHDESCNPDQGCSCGLQQVLDELQLPE